MSFFVLVYDRRAKRLVALKEFDDGERTQADAFRMEAQRHAFADGLDEEVILFQASSREVLQRTHGSYFLSEQEIADRTLNGAEAR